ncbi:hypothetical protein ACYSNW_06435 [Enterococcus sp. LJL99]
MGRKLYILLFIFLIFGLASQPVCAMSESSDDSSLSESKDDNQTQETNSSYSSNSSEVVEATKDSTKMTQQETSENSIESNDKISENDNIEATALLTGIGTVDNPVIVTNAKELNEAFQLAIPEGQTQITIQLGNDIVYTNSDTYFTINKNTTLDGNGHAILYNGTSYSTRHFQTGANGINITYKNIQFGNETYPNSNYYGILYTNNSNVSLTMENINYNINKGAQPFWGNNNVNNTLTFKGKNTFHSSGSTSGGEFVEGFRQVVFSASSQTTIYNDTTDSLALFYSTSQVITVEENASVDIETSKRDLTYAGGSLSVAKQGSFNYHAIHGTNYSSSSTTLSNSGTVLLSFDEDATGKFTTSANSFSGSNPTVNVTSPDYVLFDTDDSSKKALGSMSINVARKDTDNYKYITSYLISGEQKTLRPNLASGATETISSSSISNGQSVLYGRVPAITDFSAKAKVGPNVSSVDAMINQWSPEKTQSEVVYYKLSDQRLYTGNDITSDTSQQSIEKSNGLANTSVKADSVGESTSYSFTNLNPKKYYTYAKADDHRVPGYLLYSPWTEQTSEVPIYKSLTLPTDGISFISPIPGSFNTKQTTNNYTIINQGNVPMSIDLKKLTKNSNSSLEIDLVSQFVTRNQELTLNLIGENTGTNQQVSWDSLTEGSTPTSDPLTINPYWQENQAILYFNGNYSGPLIGPQKISYVLSFDIKTKNDG